MDLSVSISDSALQDLAERIARLKANHSDPSAAEHFEATLHLISNKLDDLERKLDDIEEDPDIDYRDLAARVVDHGDLADEVAERISVSDVADSLDASSIAEYIDVSDVASRIDVECVASNLDLSDVAEQLADRLITHPNDMAQFVAAFCAAFIKAAKSEEAARE